MTNVQLQDNGEQRPALTGLCACSMQAVGGGTPPLLVLFTEHPGRPTVNMQEAELQPHAQIVCAQKLHPHAIRRRIMQGSLAQA